MSVQDTYLGWEQLRHGDGCKRPVWEIDIRHTDNVYREPPLQHACTDEYCDHGNKFARVTVRIVCRSCGNAEIVTGEDTQDTGRTTTHAVSLGFGLPPRKTAGLWLWPGQPWLRAGRALTDEPHDFLVTRPGVKRITEDTVVGQISQGRGKRGSVIWTAAALPGPGGQYRNLSPLRWNAITDEDKPPRTVAAAAKWIAARLVQDDVVEGGR